ncbi:MAG: glutathione S-transferase family protein [Alphaproteobacteria bacterium]|nr:glutathione S-transferase family protein [Alphaproteobacteria bacterium]MCW5742644.1 glutathione S-transferase family protein [Alphaproteobacteria bacterium]
MAELKIHGFAPSTFVRATRLVAHEKGLDYDLLPPEEAGAAAHPYRRMPVARLGATVVYETLAITTWFDAIGSGPALIPADPLKRARMYQWISVVCDYLYGTISRGILLPRFGLRPAPEESVRASLAQVAELWRPIEAELAANRYLVGDQPSLADFFLVPIMFYVPEAPELAAIADRSHPSIVRWARDMGGRASVRATDPMPALREIMAAHTASAAAS